MIVKANISDTKLLSEIAMISKSFWGYTKQQLDSLVDDLTVSEKLILETHTFNFLVEDKIVGFYILNQQQNNNCELEMLFVLPNFIGKGIGKQLLQHAFKKAKNLKVKTVALLADPNAVAFYTSQGFKIIYKKESSIAGRFLPIMQKDLEV